MCALRLYIIKYFVFCYLQYIYNTYLSPSSILHKRAHIHDIINKQYIIIIYKCTKVTLRLSKEHHTYINVYNIYL